MMDDMTPSFEVSTDLDNKMLKFSARGLWGEQQVGEASAKIGEAAAPFIRQRKAWDILADYSEAIVQPRDTAFSIRNSFEIAKKLGLRRIAVTRAPILVQMQYKRLADMIDIAFFESKAEAMMWLTASRLAD
jgi:hypothetical protein